MDTLGEILRNSREEKAYSLEQVARDTNIAKKFLIALEEEDFSIFPGEPYLIGFLKNYSDYLGLESAKIVALHRNMKLQEQPAPIEELLNAGKPGGSVLLLVILVVAITGVVGFSIYNYMNTRTQEAVIEKVQEDREVTVSDQTYTYNIDTDVVEDRFPEGTELKIIFLEKTYTVMVREVSENVILSLPDGELVFNIGDEKTSDFSGDGVADISLVLNDIDMSRKTAVIKLSSLKKLIGDSESSEVPEPGSSKIESRNQNITVIQDAESPEPFVINVVFRGNTLLRYVFDRGNRVEKYFDKGETLRLDVNREVMIWIANAGSFKAKISGIDVNFGRSGEVSTHLIKWNKNSNSGKYELQMVPVY